MVFSKILFISFLLLTFTNQRIFATEIAQLPDINSIKLHSNCQAKIEQCKSNIPLKETQFPIYISRGSKSVDKVLIIIHGTDRNANEYLHDFITNIHDDNLLSSTAVIAPHFLQVNDTFSANELRWDKGWEHSWKYGYESLAPIKISSYEVIDNLIKELDRTWHPKKIIIAGHSAGAQFVQRYAHGSQISHEIKSNLTFVVSNPSSYLYSRNLRLLENKWTTPTNCPEYDQYIYGFKNLNNYFSNFEDSEEIEFNYLQNNVVYLMGSDDVLTEDLDMSCEANTQGENRITRAKNFFEFLNHYFPKHTHRFITVPNVGHDHIKMFSSQGFKNILSEIVRLEETKKELTIDRLGAKNSIVTLPLKSYFLLGGGSDIDPVFIEFLKNLAGGDLLILSGKDEPLDYNDYFTALAKKNSIPLHSVTTVLIHSKRGAEDPRLTKLISESEGIFFSGGDQWKYIERIRNTSTHNEILKKLKLGIPFGGTSAGLAILGDVIFTAQNGSVSSSEILNNPKYPRITLENSMFNISILKNIITDTHFVVRDRMGRLISFLANYYANNKITLNGFGIEEGAAVVINSKGSARVYGDGAAYFVVPTTAPNLENNNLSWQNIGIYRWPTNTAFSLSDLKTPNYSLNVSDGKINSTQENGQIY